MVAVLTVRCCPYIFRSISALIRWCQSDSSMLSSRFQSVSRWSSVDCPNLLSISVGLQKHWVILTPSMLSYHRSVSTSGVVVRQILFPSDFSRSVGGRGPDSVLILSSLDFSLSVSFVGPDSVLMLSFSRFQSSQFHQVVAVLTRPDVVLLDSSQSQLSSGWSVLTPSRCCPFSRFQSVSALVRVVVSPDSVPMLSLLSIPVSLSSSGWSSVLTPSRCCPFSRFQSVSALTMAVINFKSVFKNDQGLDMDSGSVKNHNRGTKEQAAHQNRWSSPPMDISNSRGVTNALPNSGEEIGYLM
ncbi:hypothetical protein EVAR_30335_1 [Eumeta japonica]|uniref:Uncharacterized protein n=1 Tax=Eumeta variegata TaxID=151549 RepID=A0A4C1W9A4_EUMVA|nr:hypothetical protein EVAR_30335_1 [Eumeta japonica]